MKKTYLVIWLSIFLLTVSGCQNLSDDKIEKTAEEENEYSSEVRIGFGWNSHIARIDNQEEIKKLEDLFNGAEFYETDEPDEPIQRPRIRIYFRKNEGTTHFIVGANDVIELKDGSHVKSKQIKSEDLISIFQEYVAKNRQEEIKRIFEKN